MSHTQIHYPVGSCHVIKQILLMWLHYIYKKRKEKVECSTCSFSPVAGARKSLPNGLTGPQGTQLPLTALSVFRDDKPPRPPAALPSLQSSLSSANNREKHKE